MLAATFPELTFALLWPSSLVRIFRLSVSPSRSVGPGHILGMGNPLLDISATVNAESLVK